ncbi:MAG: phosphoribosyl-AMP cyclohydrolase [Methanobrevibacter sp.]|uniref:phosphoribosyl-AMP cyclohydrolase n=1 Tax=Methanobrevibacter sp. TaxID=66852 RepID=UPI0026E0A65B|nr:phosphoribosyl-AMP cyclohydrolase [Methanobrevibacter sp.]MDO5847964.1 phosphoribosyl-AMP cyclohydrolase [Methanobrevibacter sp.]
MKINFRHEINGEKLITAIAQDYETNEILMVANMNEEALRKTIETGKAHYWSTSRNKQWLKGESSGHVQEVKEILVDCDMDAVILKIKQTGAACHEGYYSCFFRKININNKPNILGLNNEDIDVISERLFNPDEIY